MRGSAIKLTQNQKAALARDRNISVTAGAGTGKTLILVQRYLQILIEGEADVRQILAITFTNKAAAEMMDRVTTSIDSLLVNEENEKIRQRLYGIRNQLSSAAISTIHAFCARLLREFPLEAEQLDPVFVQLSEAQIRTMIEESIQTEISRLKKDDPSWRQLFRIFGVQTIFKMLESALAHRYQVDQILPSIADKKPAQISELLDRLFLEMINQNFVQEKNDQIRHLVDRVLAENQNPTAESEKKQSIINLLLEFKRSEQATSEYWHFLFQIADVFTKTDNTAYRDLRTFGGKKVWADESLQPLLDLSKLLTDIARWNRHNISNVPGAIDEQVVKNLQKFYQLYRQVVKTYTNNKRQISAVDYEDLQIMTLNLLQRNPQIQKKVADRHRYVMVDEFQDTNKLQWQIISCLAGKDQDKLFIVGDPKQSIYGFRDADVRVFNRVKESFKKANPSSDHQLIESFRFKEVISDFINEAFSVILTENGLNQWEVNYHPVRTRRVDAQGGKVELLVADQEDQQASQEEFIANRILTLFANERIKPGDIAIILRARTHLSEIEGQLRAHDIPFLTIGGIGFYQGQEIFDTYHLLRFLINPEDDFSLIAVLRSPFAQISDEALFWLAVQQKDQSYWKKLNHLNEIEHISQKDRKRLSTFQQQASHWIQRRDRVGYFELLSQIFNESLYRPVISADLRGDQILANIHKILRSTLDFEKGRLSSIADFTESLRKLIHTHLKEGEAITSIEDDHTVKILTIHQAKGLEFPVVFLPFLEQQNQSYLKQAVYFNDQFGIVPRLATDYRDESSKRYDSYFLLDLARLDQKNKEMAELKRLFYVGCSRAKDTLILSGALKKDQIAIDTPLSWLLDAFSLPADKLQEGMKKVSKKGNFEILRSYERREKISDIQKTRAFKSLEKVRRLQDEALPEPEKYSFLKGIKDQPKGEVFSATQLMTFLNDRSEYYRRYHLGFFEDDYDKLGMAGNLDSIALLRGKILHQMMEQYPDFDLEQSIREMDVTDSRLISNLRSELQQLLSQIKMSGEIKPILNATSFETEVTVLKKIDGDFITGTLDRIFQDVDGLWHIIDYKTNRISKKQIHQTVKSYQVQLEVYALLLSSVYRSQKSYKVGLYFIYPDEIHWTQFNLAGLTALEDKYRQVIRSIKRYYPYTSKPVIEESGS